MSILDRFRKQPEWKSPDPAVRADAVRHLSAQERDVLTDVARTDPDPHVRRAAVRRLDVVEFLRERASEDEDAGVRDAAVEALVAVAAGRSEDAASALAVVQDAHHLLALARDAATAAVRRAAAGRLTTARALSTLARHAPDAAVRMDAIARLDDPASVLDVALRAEAKDVALAALDRLTDRDALARVADGARNKAAARRARAIVAERWPAPPPAPVVAAPDGLGAPVETAEDAPAPEPPVEPPTAGDAEHAARVAARVALCEQVEASPADELPARVEEVHAAWDALPALEGPEGDSLQRRFEEALADALRRHEVWLSARHRHDRIEHVCEELERIAELPDAVEMEKRWAEVRKGWTGLQSMEGVDGDLQSRYARATARLEARQADARKDRERVEVENAARLGALAEKAEAAAASAETTLRDAAQAMRAVKEAMGHLGPLPRKERDAILERVKQARAKLYTRLTELRAADEWKRWANVAVQEELIKRVEALREETDLRKAARELTDIEARWRDARQAPRDQAEALWARFKAPRDEVRKKVRAHFSGEAKQRKENLAKKEALAAEAEKLADATDWPRTAERLRAMQVEWKAIGAVPRDKAEAVWQRFRAATGRFFARQKEDRAKRSGERAKNLEQKEALIARAEALAESTEWDATAAELRRLQAEWKKIGPVRRDKSETTWQRFRAACDTFFERYKRRGQIAAEAQTAGRLAVAEKAEALAGETAAGAQEDLVVRVKAIQAEWRAVGGPSDPSLQPRFAAAMEKVAATAPDAFKGTELDPEANRRKLEAILATVEALVGEGAGEPVPESASPATLLALKWREALARNTMQGRPNDGARKRDLKQKVDAARAAWQRVGPVPGDDARTLNDRFQRACRRALANA
jgi:hypothetical protein